MPEAKGTHLCNLLGHLTKQALMKASDNQAFQRFGPRQATFFKIAVFTRLEDQLAGRDLVHLTVQLEDDEART